MSFLRSYRPLYFIYLISGVCPFSLSLSLTKNAVKCSVWSLLYPIVLNVSLVYGIVHFWVASTFNENILDSCDTGTCNYVLIIQSLAILILFNLASVHTIFTRSGHVQLLNEIVNIEEQVENHLKMEILPSGLIRRICVRNWLLIMINVVLYAYALYGLEISENVNQ